MKHNASIPDANSLHCHDSTGPRSTIAIARLADDGPRKILLPRRPGESKFAPPQYYYPASRSGVIPCGRFAA
jgi:hypothetical protein